MPAFPRTAVLDLGTNTFHLLIIEMKGKKEFEVLFKAEKYVGLAEEGIHHIGEKAFARGVNQLKEYRKVIEQHQPEKIFAFGTAALRNADNGDEFIQTVFKETEISVKKISGDEEAELICEGVRHAVTVADEPVLIMDIGGGSTEFIITNDKEVFWKQSFPVGASVLKQRFHHTEPVSSEEKKALATFLEEELSPLFNQQKKYIIHHLIGASGSFDSFASMITAHFYPSENRKDKSSFEMKREELNFIFQELEKRNLEERLRISGLLSFRAPMIVMASILTETVINHFPIKRISQSGYALKEGVVWRLSQVR